MITALVLVVIAPKISFLTTLFTKSIVLNEYLTLNSLVYSVYTFHEL